jgi:lysophospholipase L1-like esterase
MLATLLLTVNKASAQSGVYAALGDSVAAGLGVSPPAAGDPVCGVSSKAYPARVAREFGMRYQNLSCSGATAGDLFTEQHLSSTRGDIEPQLPRAFAGGTPSLITITAGANDTYWQYFIRKCYVATCGTSFDRAAAASLVSILRIKLEVVMAEINFRAHGRLPFVILTGYYRPFSPTCANRQDSVTAEEFSWLNGQTDAINQALADTANLHSSFVRFAPVDFGGHALCTSKSWVQGVQSNAPFHPTAHGQQVIADAVLEQLR